MTAVLLLCCHGHPLGLSTLCSPFQCWAGWGGPQGDTASPFGGSTAICARSFGAGVSPAPRCARVLQGWCCCGTPVAAAPPDPSSCCLSEPAQGPSKGCS